MAKTNQLCKSKVWDINETKKMVGSKIYENDSYLRAVVGSHRETGAIQFKKFFLFFLFHQKTLLVNYFQKPWQYLKSSSGDPFLRKIGKFKIGLNLEIMQGYIYIYIFSGCENCLLKNHAFLLYVILKAFFGPPKLSARRKCIKCTLIYDLSVLTLFS